MTPKEILQDCKNEVAIKYGFSAWELGANAMLTHISNEELLSKRWEEAMQLYAKRIAEIFAEWKDKYMVTSPKGHFLKSDYWSEFDVSDRVKMFNYSELYQLFINQLNRNL